MPERFIDISVPLHSGMISWPGDPEVTISRVVDQSDGHEATISRLDMGAHTGTHMDAPLHFLQDSPGMEAMPLNAVIGPCRVVELTDKKCVSEESLAPHSPQRGERLILKTRNSRKRWWETSFNKNFVYISAEAAHYLARCEISSIGIDYLSVGGYYKDGVETHQALLKAGIWIMEGLDLTQVQPGNYNLICLPLKISGGDGAPARAVLVADV